MAAACEGEGEGEGEGSGVGERLVGGEVVVVGPEVVKLGKDHIGVGRDRDRDRDLEHGDGQDHRDPPRARPRPRPRPLPSNSSLQVRVDGWDEAGLDEVGGVVLRASRVVRGGRIVVWEAFVETFRVDVGDERVLA